ncbi:MAG: arginine--tRNA ligase [Candidatus Omnitrophica bacterium]|nr:arginine--tRNA ligase [Candidatus Omnitrophota bacterium]
MRKIYENLSRIIEKIIETKYSVNLTPPLWEVPRDKAYGDLSTTVALRIASILKREVKPIAEEIKKELIVGLGDIAEKVDIVEPGFINIFISQKGLIDSLEMILAEKSNFFRQNRTRRVILEFVSANPTGPLSIAHGRQAIVGDVIGKVLEFFGNEVIREYYINDEGRQIDLLIHSVEERIKEIRGEDFKLPEDGYWGEYVKDIAQECMGVDKERLRDAVIDKMLSLIKSELTSLRVEFNSWFSQRKMIERGLVEKVIDLLKTKNLVYEEEKALWFKAKDFGDDKDRVLRKADGELTYFASDIAYHRNKIYRKAEKLINLWGPDHHGYINRVKASIKALGYPEDILEIIIIQLVTIKTKERMSRRKGTAILLRDLIEEVGVDATRFYYLLRRNSSPLEFDIDLAKSFSFDNPLYYIQYAHARILSIFRKAEIKEFSPSYNRFLEGEDLSLLRSILEFNYCLDKVYYSLEPVNLVEYLKNLASLFHNFYERRRILSSNINERFSRLNLLEALRVVLDTGLRLLGIEPLTKM